MRQAEGVEAPRASEVHNLDGVEVGHHDVVGLEVQVEDAAVVEVLDSLEDLDQVTHDVVLGVTEPFVSRWREKKKKKGSQMFKSSVYVQLVQMAFLQVFLKSLKTRTN